MGVLFASSTAGCLSSDVSELRLGSLNCTHVDRASHAVLETTQAVLNTDSCCAAAWRGIHDKGGLLFASCQVAFVPVLQSSLVQGELSHLMISGGVKIGCVVACVGHGAEGQVALWYGRWCLASSAIEPACQSPAAARDGASPGSNLAQMRQQTTDAECRSLGM